MSKKTKLAAVAVLLACLCLCLTACADDKLPSATEYTINFLNYDGSVLKIAAVKSGEKPVYDQTPTRPSDREYVYTFVGWKTKDGTVYNELPQIYANTAFTAEYSAQKRTYKITFALPGQNVEIYVEAGKVPVYDGATEVEYDGVKYIVTGWNKPLQAAYGEETYTALLEREREEVPTRNVTFVVGNEQITFAYPVGTNPKFFGTPYKKAAEHSVFVFVGWQGVDGTTIAAGEQLPALTDKDVTYTAVFDEKANSYRVKLYNYDGTLLCDTTAEYGKTPTFGGIATRESTQKYDYVFDGWTDGVTNYDALPRVTSDIVLRAVYKAVLRKYTLTVNYSDGVASYTDKLAYGDSYNVPSPSVEGKYADKAFVSGVIVEDTTVNVTYRTAVVWDGSISTSLTASDGASGEAGSRSNPYLITCGADLAYLADVSFQKNYGQNTCYKLVADIDLADISWKPICTASGVNWVYFEGNFDGNNHTIYNLNVDTKYKKAGLGLFGGVSGSVSNLTITGKIVAKNRLGALCYVLKGGKLEHIDAYVDITATAADNGAYTGGLVGMANQGFAITNSNNYGKVTCLTQANAGSQVGGIVGLVQNGVSDVDNKIVGCANYGKISAYRWVGGIVGYMAAPKTVLTLTDCNNYGEVAGTANGVGGIIAYAEMSNTAKLGSVARCFNYATVAGNNYVGGVIGWTKSTETDECGNYGYVKGGRYVGGVVGAATGRNLSYCFNYGNVYGTESSVGGICGTFETTTAKVTLSNCSNYGGVVNASSSTTAAVGGVVGSVKSVTVDGKLVSLEVTKCANKGDVYGINNFVGGIVGSNNGGRVTSSENVGTVRSLNGVYVGGIAGSNYGYGYVGGCVNYGVVAGAASVGQICGQLTSASNAESNTERGLAVVA